MLDGKTVPILCWMAREKCLKRSFGFFMFYSPYLYVAFVFGSNGLGNILFFHGVVDFDTLYFVVSLLINIFMVGWLHVNATLPIIY